MVAVQDAAKDSLQLAPLRVAIVGGPADGDVIELADPTTILKDQCLKLASVKRPANIGMVENGNHNVSVHLLLAICQILGCEVEEIFTRRCVATLFKEK